MEGALEHLEDEVDPILPATIEHAVRDGVVDLEGTAGLQVEVVAVHRPCTMVSTASGADARSAGPLVPRPASMLSEVPLAGIGPLRRDRGRRPGRAFFTPR